MDRSAGRLWAPWRMEYIRKAENEARRGARKAGSNGGRRTTRSLGKHEPRVAPGECLFCLLRKPRDDRRDLVLLRRPQAFLMLNRFPYNPAHLMVAVARHVASFGELTAEEWRDLGDLTGLAERALASEYRPHGVNYGANLGRVAGAGFPGHLHLHLVPRWNGDTNFMPTVADTKVLPESLSRTWSRLRRAL
ncbi:MAG TPA: HIT domain-containing protein, partial [Dongiaceae bacterium]|nr:HIT domain-containing protein [Dongiaceae bacterium]